MTPHINFYENLKEALARLRGTIVVYDGVPYYVSTITNHKPDTIFRVYLSPLGMREEPGSHVPHPELDQYPPEHPAIGPYMDKFIIDFPKAGILRKRMNSPLFNRFRPYPLGMCNIGKRTCYIERQPNRKMEQGLIRSMLNETMISTSPEQQGAMKSIDIMSKAFKTCVVGDHPSAHTVLAALKDPSIENESVAFHRDFALVRGPISMLFLAYKSDVVGVLPNDDFSLVRLGADFRHVKEAVASLNLFTSIV